MEDFKEDSYMQEGADIFYRNVVDGIVNSYIALVVKGNASDEAYKMMAAQGWKKVFAWTEENKEYFEKRTQELAN